jgi:chemotaxis protein MotB
VINQWLLSKILPPVFFYHRNGSDRDREENSFREIRARKVGEHGGACMMKQVSTFLAAVASLVLVGCVSQQSHERALQDYEMSQEASAEEIIRLQQVVAEKQTEVAQLQETKKELEQTVEVQDQIKDQHLAAVKQELEALYAQVKGLENTSGDNSITHAIFGVEPMDFDDLAAALKKVRSSLHAQMGDVSQLREQNSQLEKEFSALEARLKEVERLKKELEQVRRAREIQEAQLAKVKHEVLTVGEEIERITKALEEKFLGLNIMKQVGQVLATLPEKYIQVEGHTDNKPISGRLQQQYPTNWELSTARATTVLRYLIEQTKMDPKAFGATGYADTRPVTTNDSEEGRAQNRRVEIVLYPERVIQESEKIATLAE